MQRTRALPLVALLAQLSVLARIADLGAGASLTLLGAGAAAALRLRAPPALAWMIGAGGLGMTLGWWADLGFTSAAELALLHGADAIWCRTPAPGATAGLAQAFAPLASWMNAGMLLFALPAARWLEPTALLRCCVGMLLGMGGTARLAAQAASRLDPAAAALVAWVSMSAGMLGGMLVVERLARRRSHPSLAASAGLAPR